MPYAERHDLNLAEERLVELTDSKAAHGVVDEALLTRLRIRAEGIVDGYCGRYALPLSPLPELVRSWTASIWRYLVYAHRETMTMPETVRNDYVDALRDLRRVNDSQLSLACAPATSDTAPAPTGGGIEQDVERIFGRGRDGL